jgi:hypothetical protein
MTKPRRMRRVRHVELMVEEDCIYDTGGKVRRKGTAGKTKT